MNCSVNGCHCPQGMVVNTLINRCVPPQTCPASKLTSILQGNRVHTISSLYIDNKNPHLLYYAKNSNTQHILQNVQIMVKLYHMHMWQHYKDSYSALTFIFSTECPIEGQIRRRCAIPENCTQTCDNRDEPMQCSTDCNFTGCYCPEGMVVNTLINRCVVTQGCPPSKSSVHRQKKQLH